MTSMPSPAVDRSLTIGRSKGLGFSLSIRALFVGDAWRRGEELRTGFDCIVAFRGRPLDVANTSSPVALFFASEVLVRGFKVIGSSELSACGGCLGDYRR